MKLSELKAGQGKVDVEVEVPEVPLVPLVPVVLVLVLVEPVVVSPPVVGCVVVVVEGCVVVVVG